MVFTRAFRPSLVVVLGLSVLLASTACSPAPNSRTAEACPARPTDQQIKSQLAVVLGGQESAVYILGVLHQTNCNELAVLFTSDIRRPQAFGPAQPVNGVARLAYTDNGQWFVFEDKPAPSGFGLIR
jgi:hypothetical protein